MSYYRQQLEDWLKTLDVKAGTVLDIGGAQGQVKNRVRSWDVREYAVYDIESEVENGNARVLIDLDDPFYLDNFEPRADLIFCLEVFEYLINPLNGLRVIESLLMPSAKAYITFAFVYPHHNELDRDSLRYTEPGIRRLAAAAGLKVSNVLYREDQSGYLEKFYESDGMRAAKQYAHHDATGFIVEFQK